MLFDPQCFMYSYIAHITDSVSFTFSSNIMVWTGVWVKMFLFLSKMAVGSVADTDVWINTPFRVVITIALGMEAAETVNIDLQILFSYCVVDTI